MNKDKLFVEQIIDSCEKITSFVDGINYEEFLRDQKTQSAVVLQLILVGELSKRLSEETKVEIDLPWKEITGFRDFAVHNYFELDLPIVWETIARDLKDVHIKLKQSIDPVAN